MVLGGMSDDPWVCDDVHEINENSLGSPVATHIFKYSVEIGMSSKLAEKRRSAATLAENVDTNNDI